ncbi:MAG TPA: hypothetical protein VMS73_04065 [Anaerolineaceae bacterium]|nr:hypothetical protein [Anaerolineaceae bacterium]
MGIGYMEQHSARLDHGCICLPQQPCADYRTGDNRPRVRKLLAQLEKKPIKIGFIVCLAAFVLLNITPVPCDPITLLVIAWKGPVAAIILSTVGDTLSGFVDYYIGASVGDVTDFEQKKAKLQSFPLIAD